MDVEAAYERILANPGVVFLVGAIDSGKTTFGVELMRRATDAGTAAAYVDADIGQSTVGPPATVGLKLVAGMREVNRESIGAADALSFVGSVSPRGHFLPLTIGSAKLVDRARGEGCRLVVVDSTGFVSGLSAQILKFHKMDLIRPDFVVAFERGGELDPIIDNAKRFTPAEVIELDVPQQVVPRTVDERMTFREKRFAAYFENGVFRWRVKPTVFMPSLPPEFDLAQLDGILVGMEDGKGGCPGIGVLEYDAEEQMLRMVSPVTEGVRGLRLGSIRIDTEGNTKGSVDLRDLFRTE